MRLGKIDSFTYFSTKSLISFAGNCFISNFMNKNILILEIV